MKIDRTELLSILTNTSHFMDSSDIIEQSSDFIFTGSSVVNFTGEIVVSTPFITDFSCSVNKGVFVEYMKSLRGKFVEISLKPDRNDILVIKTKAQTLEIAVVDKDNINDNYNLIELPKTLKKFKRFDETFLHKIDSAKGFTSDEDNTDQAKYVEITKDYIFATYNAAAIAIKHEFDINDCVLLDKQTCDKLIKLAPTHMYNTKDFIFFKKDNTIVGIKKFDNVVPSIENPERRKIMFGKDYKGEINLPDAIKDMVNRAKMVLGGEIEKPTVVVSGKGIFAISTTALGVKNANRELKLLDKAKIDYKGKSFKFKIGIDALQECIEASSVFKIDNNILRSSDKTYFFAFAIEGIEG